MPSVPPVWSSRTWGRAMASAYRPARDRPAAPSADSGGDLRRRRLGQVARHRHALETLHDAVLVAADEERTAQALRPDAGVQLAALVDQGEPARLEEADLVRPGEQDRHADPARLGLAGGHQRPAHAAGPYVLRDRQAPHLGDVAPQQVERAVAREGDGPVLVHDLGDEEVAKVLEDVLHRTDEHLALRRPVADVLEDRRHVLCGGVPDPDLAAHRVPGSPASSRSASPAGASSGSSASSSARSVAIRSRTRLGAVPPQLVRPATTVSSDSASYTSASIRASSERISSSGSASSGTSRAMAVATMRPTTSCASRNGSPFFAR